MNFLKAQKEGTISSGSLKGVAFSFDGSRTYNDFEYIITPIKKDKTEGKPKKQTTMLLHTFCPFCGEEHKKSKSPIKNKEG